MNDGLARLAGFLLGGAGGAAIATAMQPSLKDQIEKVNQKANIVMVEEMKKDPAFGGRMSHEEYLRVESEAARRTEQRLNLPEGSFQRSREPRHAAMQQYGGVN